MLQHRVIPCLQLKDDSLVKTVRYKNPSYIGDPVNTVRIFNELEVDEICFLGIRAGIDRKLPSMELLQQISDECFCPLSYGGGIDSLEMAGKILSTGFEKVILNTAAWTQPGLISRIADKYGSQAVVVAIDVKKNIWGRPKAWIRSATKQLDQDPVAAAREMERQGAGELLVTSVDREGTWDGLDVPLIRSIADAVHIPVIAHGGAGSVSHIGAALQDGHASGVALGSMVVYQRKGLGVLVSFPDSKALDEVRGL